MATKIMSRHNALFSSNYIVGRHLGVGATSTVFECYKGFSIDKITNFNN